MVWGVCEGLHREPKWGCADDEVLCDSVLPSSQPESSFGVAGPHNGGCQDPRINCGAWRGTTYSFIILLNVLGH